MSEILTSAGTILSAALVWMTDIAEWIVATPLALLFVGMMLILFGIRLVRGLCNF